MLRIFAPLLAVILAATVAGAPVDAQTGRRQISSLTRPQIDSLGQRLRARGDLAGLLNEYVPYFRVPAHRRVSTLCRVTYGGGLECWTEERIDSCPTEIELQLPGVPTPARIPVTCIGPDLDGNCECDFAPG